MKKLVFTLVALSSAAALVGCGKTQTTIPENQPKQSFKSMAQDSALSSISMLNTGYTKGLRRQALTDAQKTNVLNKLDLVDELLKGDAIKSEEVAVSEGDVYFGTYDKYYTLTVNQIDGNTEDYKFYYTETLEAPEADEDDDDDKKDEEEEEVSSNLDGVVLLGQKTYKMHGEKEVSKEGQEVEVEYSFVITDEETKEKVIVKHESETGGDENENEYSFARHDASGKLVEKVKIDFEQENNETEYSVKTLSNGDKKHYKFKFEEKGGQKFVKVKIIENQEIVEAKLQVTDTGYEFIV